MTVSSSSPTPKFNKNQNGTPTTTTYVVTMTAGTQSFTAYYGDSTAPATPTLTAAATGLTSGKQVETITPIPTKLVFSTQPGGSVGEGVTFTQPVVTVEDANSNPVAGIPVTLSIAGYTAGNGGTTQGTLTCTTNPVTSSSPSGTATFAGCTITGTAAAGTYTFKATGAGLTGNATGTVTITAGPASTLAFSTSPAGSVGEGAAFSTQPVVTAKDANGNGVSGVAVTTAINGYTAGHGGTTQGTLGCTTNPVTTSADRHRYLRRLRHHGHRGGGHLHLQGHRRGAQRQRHGQRHHHRRRGDRTIAFSTSPAGPVGEGAAFSTQPVVTAKDANGNGVSGVAVTLAINTYAAGGGGSTQGTLGCTTNPVTTSAAGTATFAGCAITGNAAAGTYTFKATAGALSCHRRGQRHHHGRRGQHAGLQHARPPGPSVRAPPSAPSLS